MQQLPSQQKKNNFWLIGLHSAACAIIATFLYLCFAPIAILDDHFHYVTLLRDLQSGHSIKGWSTAPARGVLEAISSLLAVQFAQTQTAICSLLYTSYSFANLWLIFVSIPILTRKYDFLRLSIAYSGFFAAFLLLAYAIDFLTVSYGLFTHISNTTLSLLIGAIYYRANADRSNYALWLWFWLAVIVAAFNSKFFLLTALALLLIVHCLESPLLPLRRKAILQRFLRPICLYGMICIIAWGIEKMAAMVLPTPINPITIVTLTYNIKQAILLTFTTEKQFLFVFLYVLSIVGISTYYLCYPRKYLGLAKEYIDAWIIFGAVIAAVVLGGLITPYPFGKYTSRYFHGITLHLAFTIGLLCLAYGKTHVSSFIQRSVMVGMVVIASLTVYAGFPLVSHRMETILNAPDFHTEEFQCAKNEIMTGEAPVVFYSTALQFPVDNLLPGSVRIVPLFTNTNILTWVTNLEWYDTASPYFQNIQKVVVLTHMLLPPYLEKMLQYVGKPDKVKSCKKEQHSLSSELPAESEVLVYTSPKKIDHFIQWIRETPNAKIARFAAQLDDSVTLMAGRLKDPTHTNQYVISEAQLPKGRYQIIIEGPRKPMCCAFVEITQGNLISTTHHFLNEPIILNFKTKLIPSHPWFPFGYDPHFKIRLTTPPIAACDLSDYQITLRRRT